MSDADKRVAVAYGIVADAEAPRPARISYLIGPDGRIAKAYPKVVALEHPDEVLADLG